MNAQKAMNDLSLNFRAFAQLCFALLAIQPTHAELAASSAKPPSHEVHAASAPTPTPQQVEAAQTTKKLESVLDASDAANKTARAFLSENNISAPSGEAFLPPDKPLDMTCGPEDTLIHSAGSTYFNAEQGVMVYLKDVTVKSPHFNLSGANVLKIFLASKTPEQLKAVETIKTTKVGKADTSSEASTGFGTVGKNFDGISHILATGAVHILQKQTEEEKKARKEKQIEQVKSAEPEWVPIEASGAMFDYNVKTGETIISGGYPWVKQGDKYFRANKPNLRLLLHKNGSFTTEGDWDMGGKIDQSQSSKDKSKKTKTPNQKK
jgi:hypothetical protein